MQRHGVGGILHAFEETGDFVEAVDEDEAANFGELRRDGVHEVQREAREGRDGPRHVGDDEDLGLGGSRRLEAKVDRHPTGREAPAHRVTQVDRPATTSAALSRESHGELSA